MKTSASCLLKRGRGASQTPVERPGVDAAPYAVEFEAYYPLDGSCCLVQNQHRSAPTTAIPVVATVPTATTPAGARGLTAPAAAAPAVTATAVTRGGDEKIRGIRR